MMHNPVQRHLSSPAVSEGAWEVHNPVVPHILMIVLVLYCSNSSANELDNLMVGLVPT